MVNSKNLPNRPPASPLQALKRDSIPSQVAQFLTQFFANQKLTSPRVLIAFSGGLDSCVLLHMLASLRAVLPFQLSAMHVHHGISANADAWADFCEKTCQRLNIPFQLCKINIDKNSGLGLEATARNARYQALSKPQADFICLAHHQDDQAETLLLQLARGAGVKGLAGMAQVDIERKLLRPLLQFSRAQLTAYARAKNLQWIEDESNDDTQFDRNFMRHEVLPKLLKRYPAITEALSRSASHLADANDLLDTLAQADAKNFTQHKELNLAAFNSLNEARASNLMRWWLAQNLINMPSTLQMQQILQQMLTAKSDALVKIKVSDNQYLRRYQGSAYLVEEVIESPPIHLLWQGEPEIILPDGTKLIFTKKQGEGLALPRGIQLRIKNRAGGERFKPELGRPSRTLKYVLQSCAMPPWQREQLPLIFMDETLVIIPNIGVDASLQAASHELGLQVRWEEN